jgi:hypothetical protein
MNLMGQRNGQGLAQLLAQTRVLGGALRELRKADAPDFQSGEEAMTLA